MKELCNGITVLTVVKALDYSPRGPRFQPHYSNRDFFHLGVYSALPKKVSRHILKCFHLKFTLHPLKFGGDVKPLVLGDLVQIGSCLLQALVGHYCGKPLRGNKKQKQKKKNKNKK